MTSSQNSTTRPVQNSVPLDRLALLRAIKAAETARGRWKTAEKRKDRERARTQVLTAVGYLTGYLDGQRLLESDTRSGYSALHPEYPAGSAPDDNPLDIWLATLRQAVDTTRGPLEAGLVAGLSVLSIGVGEVINYVLD